MSQLYGKGSSSSFVATTSDYEKVVERNRRSLEMVFGQFYHAGLNIWSMQELDETASFEVRLLGKPMNLVIDKASEIFIAPVNET
jgi:hypothetical protein